MALGMSPDINSNVVAAFELSPLRVLPPEVIAQLTVGGRFLTIRAGTTVHDEYEAVGHMDILLRGFVRVFVTGPDGRTLTIRYCRPGDLMGVATLFAPGPRTVASTRALVEAELFVLRPDTVVTLAERDARVARALLAEASHRSLVIRGRSSRHGVRLHPAASCTSPSGSGLRRARQS